MNPQYYQPLSAALHAPVVAPAASQQPYPDYAAHAHAHAHAHNRDAPPPGPHAHQTREEEEEEEDEDEEVVEEELDHHGSQHAPSTHSSPRPPAPPAQSSSSFTGPGGAAISHQFNTQTPQDHANQSAEADGTEKRKPGRPRGSRNRKPRAAPGTANQASKAPVNSQHPGFYQYPPAPGNAAAHAQNQQFYEFQWRALNLCSEFYNAAEELLKAASPIVIAQCYQMGPSTKIDPLAMVSEAKRVCDNLLANPSQLVGSPPPPPTSMYPPVPSYPTMPPPPPSSASASSSGAAAPVPVITNPQSFVMSLGTPAPPGPHAQPFYPPMYAQPGSRYPTTPYYSYAPGTYYAQPPPAQPPSAPPSASSAPPSTAPQNNSTPAPTPTPAPAPPPPTPAGTISTFNAATGNAAPGGQQGTWSEEETERLRKLAEQSKEVGGAQSKGEIEWDWVVHQWGNSRTRHQILLKATSMGLKESTTRGTKRRRENENTAPENNSTPSAPQPIQPAQSLQPAQSTHTSPQTHHQQHPPPAQQQAAPPPAAPIQASPTQSPSTIPSSRPATTTPTIAPNRISTGSNSATTPSTTNLPWPMPTVAANTPSPVITHSSIDNTSQRSTSNSYYRARPPAPQQQPSYTTSSTSPVNSAARPPSSHGGSMGNSHEYMYRANGAQSTQQRRQNGI